MLTLEDQIVISLRRINQAIDVWSRRLLGNYGLTGPQLATLRRIAAGRYLSNRALVKAMHMTQPTLSGILARLEEHKLILRERSKSDRRKSIVRATDEGREVALNAPTLLRDSFCQELRKLSTGEQERILRTLTRVADMMGATQITENPFTTK